MKLRVQSSVTIGGSLRLKHIFSKQHHWAARYFSEEADRIENSNMKLSEKKLDARKHRAYVTGAILSAVAALEASINELYLEAQDRNKNTLSGLNDSELSALVNKWTTVKCSNKRFERLFILDKYQEALKSVNKKEFKTGEYPYQDAASLIYLRNALVHYKPEWDDEANVHSTIKARLKGKFRLNTFSDMNSLWFPHQCLGAGCAKWSVDVIELFMSEFCKVIGIPNRF